MRVGVILTVWFDLPFWFNSISIFSGGWKNVIRGPFNEVTPPAYRYAYSHPQARGMRIWSYSTHMEEI